MYTPWGKADSVRTIAEGILKVGTPSHGGFKLDRKRNAMIPKYMRNTAGWYEEDCEAAKVAIIFSQHFPVEHLTVNMATLKNWFPDAYERYTGLAVREGESFSRDQELFSERHKNSLVAIAAWGAWHDSVPEGFVGVYATSGGVRGIQGQYFLVPECEYDKRNRIGFIVDPSRHQCIPPIS